ncbi:hypothetical protein PBY51_008747 [Eleginops maclovinus]|uniref:Uncharacterized protein n=1 Tax=Eleginops maclovinus TaxID=56733 RepID=A0AAN7WUZ3_ELEMC|nr:hypothetical protein PBY51_008747 [Eleginops maclovinus]
MACNSFFSLLCFKTKKNSTYNETDSLNDQADPSCAIMDKLHVCPVFSKDFGTRARRGGGPSIPLTVGLFGIVAAGPCQQGRAKGAPFMNVHVNSSFSHQKSAPRPISKQGPEK